MASMPSGLVWDAERYSLDEPGGVLRTEVAGGAARYGLDWDRGNQRFAITMVLDAVQFSIWNAFYFHVIHKGADAFTMPLDSGFGLADHDAHIVPGSYSAAQADSGVWSVTFAAEAESGVYAMSDADAADMAGLFNESGIVPIVSGYSVGDPAGVARDEVPGGQAGYALEYARGLSRFSVTLILTAAQFALWSVYYARIVKKGSIAFDMPLDSGFGVSPHQVNIIPGSYSAARTGGINWVATFAVEAEPQAYLMSDADAAAMIDLYNGIGVSTDALLARIAQFVLVDTLVLVGL
jgi:hypothetical protein